MIQNRRLSPRSPILAVILAPRWVHILFQDASRVERNAQPQTERVQQAAEAWPMGRGGQFILAWRRKHIEGAAPDYHIICCQVVSLLFEGYESAAGSHGLENVSFLGSGGLLAGFGNRSMIRYIRNRCMISYSSASIMENRTSNE